MPLDGPARPLSKEAQLARGPKRSWRRKAPKRRWEKIADRKGGPCRVCNGEGPNELHHLVPRAQGGSDTESNIVPVCNRCHRRVTDYDREACAILRRSLSDSEYAYAVDQLGEMRFAARYPVDFETFGRKP